MVAFLVNPHNQNCTQPCCYTNPVFNVKSSWCAIIEESLG